MATKEDAINKLKLWRAEPWTMVREEFGVEPDPWQMDVLTNFADPTQQRIAMKACKGPGKTAVLSWCAWNFLACYLHPKMAATSISKDNLADGLWTEMAKWQNNSEFLKNTFEWTKTRIYAKDHPETWWMSARSWAKGADSSQQADTLAGLHADNLLFILDEAGGIPDAVMAAAEAGLATGKVTKILMAGNPTHLEGPLYRAVTKEAHLWHVVEITGDPDSPTRSSRISIEWARAQIEKYGVDNPWVLVNVFGKFPPSSLNALLGPDECREAMDRHLRTDQYDFASRALGVDVARFGDDTTVIFPRQGMAAFKPVVMRNARTTEIAARVAQAYHKWDADAVLVDDTGGYGAGVIDALIDAGIPCIPVNFSGKSNDPRYLNKRAEMYFDLAEWVKLGGAMPNIPDLTRELTAHTYTFSNSKFKLEEKEQIKDKLDGQSPDMADALALTFAVDLGPRPQRGLGQYVSKNSAGKCETDDDPWRGLE